MGTLAALLPVLVVVCALALGWPALRAAGVGLALALGVALAQGWPAAAALAALGGWLPVALEVVFIIGGGLALGQTLQARGAQQALAGWLRQRAGQGAGAVLMVVHGVTPFAESVTGFGIGVTVGIPLLLYLGLSPARAALAGLLGLCAVPWGSMGPGTLVAARMAGLPFDALGLASAWLSLPPFLVAGWGAAWLAGKPGQRGRDFWQATASALALWLAVLACNALAGTALAGALGALLVLAGHVLLRRGRWPAWPPLATAALRAYAVLLGGLLLAGQALRAMGAMGAGQGVAPGAWQALASPALWLWAAVAVAAPAAGWRAPLARALRGWVPVAAVAVAYIALGLVMALSGMAARLAEALAQLGSAYLLAAPFVGALGGFVTGSNTGANAMLAATQAQIAVQLGAPLLPFMAAHNVAAALLLMASPAKVEMALQLCPPPALARRAWVQRAVLLAALPSVLALAVLNVVLAR
ncbi:L-lactate permease [Comamonadaceae bacterium OH2545_COT-014]|nr:L-lactate permease [Comamonadaceae bacterium OH2545_COT-014]